MSVITAGFAMCGSFCSFSQVIAEMRNLKEKNVNIIPIMSQNAFSMNTRFGKAENIVNEIEEICDRKVISTIEAAEPIGPKALLDILIIAPCTGNTLGKLANGISDTSVTLAAKAHLRNNRPVLIGVSSNDALAASAQNIGRLMNTKNFFFIPMHQDDYEKKTNSIVADFSQTYEAAKLALKKEQLQPVFVQSQ